MKLARVGNLSPARWASPTNPKLGLGWSLILLTRKNRAKFGPAPIDLLGLIVSDRASPVFFVLARFEKLNKKPIFYFTYPIMSCPYKFQALVYFVFLVFCKSSLSRQRRSSRALLLLPPVQAPANHLLGYSMTILQAFFRLLLHLILIQ